MATYKKLTFRSEARQKLLAGATQLTDAVRITLGPKSKSVLIQKQWGRPLVCNDGVTIAKEIVLKGAEENLGAQMLREVAELTGDRVGDGTSTATIITHAILQEGIHNIVAGASGIDLKAGLESARDIVIGHLKQLSRPVTTLEAKTQVATISAHNDAKIGKLVAEVLERVGKDGVISVEESKTTETEIEIVEGLQFDRGYISPYFVTQQEKMEAVLEDVYVLLADTKINVLQDLVGLLEALVKSGKPLVLIAEDIGGDALATLIVNHLRGVLRCLAVKAPAFGDRRRDLLEDMAVVTGGRVISEATGARLDAVTLEDLGQVVRVVSDREKTTLVGGRGKPELIEERVKMIHAQIEKTTSDYDKEKLEERLAKLMGGVAVVRTGAPSEAEMKSQKEAIDDAINATRAAIDEGIVPGGGLGFLRSVPLLQEQEKSLEGDARTGVQILRRAIQMPAYQIAVNSGMDGGVAVDRMLNTADSTGLDAATGEYADLYERGIVDPIKVLRIALENAVSVASTLLLTEATLTEVEEETKGAASTPNRDEGEYGLG